MGQDDLSIYFEIRLAAVTDEDKLAFGKVPKNPFKGGFLLLRSGLEESLKHSVVLLQMKRASWKTSHLEVRLQQRINLPRRVGDVVELDSHTG